MGRFGHELTSDFALQPGIDFLNNGSFGATPRIVLAAQDRLRERLEAQPVSFFVDDLDSLLADALAALAPLLGAPADQLAFVDNATTGMQVLIEAAPLGPGDVVVTTSHVYGAVRNILRHVAGRAGARVVEIPVPFPSAGPSEVVDAVRDGWPDGAKLAIFDHITSPTGLVLPVRELVDLAKARGAHVLVDGAHVPGHLHVDLSTLGADGWVGNLHKWLFAPKSAAVLHCPPAHQGRLHASVISHGYGTGMRGELHWLGTRDPTPLLASVDGLRYAESLGIEAMRTYQRELREEAASRLTAAWGTRRPAPASMLGALATLELPFHADGTQEVAGALRRRLWREHRIEVPIVPFGGRCWLRISAQVFNDLSDYERLASVVSAEGIATGRS